MFLSSFLRKTFNLNKEPPPDATAATVAESAKPTPAMASPSSLPSWKDTNGWTTGKLSAEAEIECRHLQETIFDLLKTIKDPEKTENLGQLDVITEDSVQVQPLPDGEGYQVRIDFNPTVPHCSLASLIGLCLRKVLVGTFGDRIKLDIVISEGKHNTEEEINKQINDKERVAAAMENPSLRNIVENCILEPE